ncbi:MAG: DNA-3-methyladenine glycosylase [Planctomycetota bacterium]
MTRLDPAFFARDAETLAHDLLGRTLVRVLDGQRMSGRIVETEAYLGPDDLAAHTAGWLRTPRVEPMYAKPGTAYIYMTYGMHHCLNFSADREGFPSAVLIRAIAPVDGVEIMRSHRPNAKRPIDLGNGPAKLCEALVLDRAQSGVDACRSSELFLEAGDEACPRKIASSARVGVAYAGVWATKPLRFFLDGEAHVSKGRPTTSGDVRKRLG